MAMESGEILTKAIESNLSAEKIARIYKKSHREKFQKRLRICNLMRRAAFAPNLAKYIISALSLGEKPRELLARATRPKLSTLEK